MSPIACGSIREGHEWFSDDSRGRQEIFCVWLLYYVSNFADSKSTRTALTELTKQQLSVRLIATQRIRTVSDEQCSTIGSILKQSRIHLGTTRQTPIKPLGSPTVS